MAKVIDSTNLGYLIGKMKAAFLPKGNTETVGVDATPTASSTNLVESGGVYSFVGDPIVSLTVPTPNDGTVIFTHRSGDTTTLDLNHQHLDYPKYYECSDEAEYAAIQNKDAGTLYLIPES